MKDTALQKICMIDADQKLISWGDDQIHLKGKIGTFLTCSQLD